MHLNNYIYLFNKRSFWGDSFVPHLSAFPFCMSFHKRFGTPVLQGSNSPFDPCVPSLPSQSSGTYLNAHCLLLDLFKRLLNTLLPGLIKHSAKASCCVTRDLIFSGSPWYRLLKAPTQTTQKTYPERVLAWRLLDKYDAAIILFFSPFKRYLPSSHTDVAVLKTQPSKERIKQ